MNRVALDLGIIQIYWYSICILVGMMIGMFLVYKESRNKGIPDSLITNLIFYTIIVAIIGARIYYVAFDWGYYSKNPIEMLEIWNGGLAIHGAIILGGLFLIYYTKQHKMDVLKVLDICSVGLIIGQAIGRWGNFFNQEVYGGVVSLDYLKGLHLPSFIIDGMKIAGEYHKPLFLYESIWCVIGFVILLFVRKRKYIKTGQIFGIYCMWYSVGRFFLEGMRDSKYNLMIGSLKIAQIVSIGMFAVGLFFFIRRLKTSRFEYLYNEEGINIESVEHSSSKKSFFGKKEEKKKTSIIPKELQATPSTEAPTTQLAPQLTPEATPQTNPPTMPPTMPPQPQNNMLFDNNFQNQAPVLNNQMYTGGNNNNNGNANNNQQSNQHNRFIQ